MSIKERHYVRELLPVARFKGDVSDALDEHMQHQFEASIFLPQAVSPEKPALMPSADGKIARMLFTIPNYAVQQSVMADTYRSLLASLPSHTSLVMLVQKSAEPAVKQWLSEFGLETRTELNTFEDTLNISIWAEDGYVVARDAATERTYFVEPYAFPRYADGLVADFVSNFTDLRNTQAPLYFQGGNTLIGDDFLLIGADYPAHSLDYTKSGVLSVPAGKTPVQFIKEQYAKYLDVGRQIIYVGSKVPVPTQKKQKVIVNGEEWTETIYYGNSPKGTVQPLFHIDMFMTLAGRGQDNKYRILIGDPSKAYAVLGQTPPPYTMQGVFDDIANTFSQLGYEVIRNPLPLAYMDDPAGKERVWYFATANNALVEVPTKTVWLPTYGHGGWAELAAVDQANKQVWETLGFQVRLLGDFHPFAENLGAVHCIKKYLARS